MTEQTKHVYRAVGPALAILVAGTLLLTEAKGGGLPDDPVVRRNIVSEIQALYGLTEHQAIKRLQAEYQAAELYRLIRNTDIKGYAGSWFGEEDWTLHVALSDPADKALVISLAATPVPVAYSLSELKVARRLAEATLKHDRATRNAMRSSHIDFEANRVVIGVIPGFMTQAESVVTSLGLETDMIMLTVDASQAVFSAAIKGADATRNYTWDQAYGGTHPCSVGASIVGGYVTAGHCGYQNNEIRTPAGQPLGTVADSTAVPNSNSYQYDEDGGWVDTIAGWTPTPEINNYGPGTLYVNAEWSGTLEGAVNTSVCRYGQTSGGSHCGQITARNEHNCFGGEFNCIYIDGLIKTSGLCIKDGDSGGPLVMSAGQVQGTLTGGTGNSCSDADKDGDVDDPSDTAYFQPIETTLSRFQPNGQPLIMLTTHGANAPIINGLDCIELGQLFLCGISNYESQGETDILWTSGLQSGTGPSFSGNCPQWGGGGPISVSLSVTNPYGTTQETTYVDCPAGP